MLIIERLLSFTTINQENFTTDVQYMPHQITEPDVQEGATTNQIKSVG
jgi:hypothetical protein